jgi:hypothetical protein
VYPEFNIDVYSVKFYNIVTNTNPHWEFNSVLPESFEYVINVIRKYKNKQQNKIIDKHVDYSWVNLQNEFIGEEYLFYNIAYGVTNFKFRATFRYLFSERLVDYLMKNEDYNQWYPFRILSDFLDNFDKYREENSERISKLILIRTYELDSLYCTQSITDQ